MRTRRTFLVAGLIMAAGTLPAPLWAAAPTVLLLPFSFFDTSGEPRDQTTDHSRRVAAITQELGGKLEHSGLFRTVVPAADSAPCPAGDATCLLGQARQAGADLILTGAVQKVSTMMIQLWVGVFDAADGKRVFFRQLNFRGDNDEAWHRATAFLFDQIAAEPPKKS